MDLRLFTKPAQTAAAGGIPSNHRMADEPDQCGADETGSAGDEEATLNRSAVRPDNIKQ